MKSLLFVCALLLTSSAAVADGAGRRPPQTPAPAGNPNASSRLPALTTQDRQSPPPVLAADPLIRDKGTHLVVTAVRLKNLGPKPVRAVKLNWRLVESGEDSEVVAQEGLPTPFIRLPNDLRTGAESELKPADFRISKLLLPGRALGEGRRIELTVSDVIFADGSKWRPTFRVTPL